MAELTAAGVVPLMFGFTDLIEGRGFVARIRTNGRAVVEQDDESAWWVNGVNPGGVCASGDTAQDALRSFRLALREVLLDCAVNCGTFDAFRSEIEIIFNSTNENIVGEWRDAALALRQGAEAGPLEGLDRMDFESREYAVTVEEIVIQDTQPQQDGQPEYAQAA